MKYFFAPVQGHTDAAYRHFHHKKYGGQIIYTTPFIRLENGKLRPKDLKDLNSPLNEGLILVPQIIFRNREELTALVELIKKEGFSKIDLNMGCPFPLQTGHGRGAAAVADESLAETVEEVVKNNPDISFSVKLRLGLNNPDEWKILLPHLNKIPLDHIALHPRVAKQQYDGDLYMDKFEEFLRESKNPVVFNGEIKSPEDALKIKETYPGIAGLMIGRGALARPSIFREIVSGKEEENKDRLVDMLDLHRMLFAHYENVLCGESQLMSKISPFWEYAEDEIGRKLWKQVKKAKTLPKYRMALSQIK